MSDNSRAAVMERKGEVTEGSEEKYLTFKLAEEEYGLEILKVREIIGMMEVTKVPRTPDYVRGVVNLRGKVIPVIDLRKKFNMAETEDTIQTCIIVVAVQQGEDNVEIGVLVDSVSEVLDIPAQDIEDPPTFGSDFNSDFILGMAKAEDSVKILLNIDKVLTASEISSLSAKQNAETSETKPNPQPSGSSEKL